jgi:flagellar basal body-associated protein FliL
MPVCPRLRLLTYKRVMKTSLKALILFVILALSLTMAAPSFANEGGEKKEEGGDPYVKLSQVAIPITNAGQVTNYIYLSIRLNLNPKANMAKLREKEPYFRDALVRTSYKNSFGQKDRDDLLDEARFKAVMLPVFAQVAGPNAIASIEILAQTPNRQRGRRPPPTGH